MNRIYYYKQLSFNERMALKAWIHWPGRAINSLFEFLTKPDENSHISKILVEHCVCSGIDLLNGEYDLVMWFGKQIFKHAKKKLNQQRNIVERSVANQAK